MADFDRIISELRSAQEQIARLEKENKQMKRLLAEVMAALREPNKRGDENGK